MRDLLRSLEMRELRKRSACAICCIHSRGINWQRFAHELREQTQVVWDARVAKLHEHISQSCIIHVDYVDCTIRGASCSNYLNCTR
jgi:hypothetical protein